MDYIIKNDQITVTISDMGAEMMSIKKMVVNTFGRVTASIGQEEHAIFSLSAEDLQTAFTHIRARNMQ